MNWAYLKDEFPKKRTPILLKDWAGTVQHVTYYLDCDDAGMFWQDVGDNHEGVPVNMKDSWMYLPKA